MTTTPFQSTAQPLAPSEIQRLQAWLEGAVRERKGMDPSDNAFAVAPPQIPSWDNLLDWALKMGLNVRFDIR